MCLVNAGIKILTVAEFFSEKDMDGGQSPELAGKARLSGGGVIGWRAATGLLGNAGMNDYSRGSVTNYAEFCSEKDMDGGQSPELAGKARLSGGGVIGWRILVTQVIGWRSILIG